MNKTEENKMQLEYASHTQTLIGTKQKTLQDVDTGEVITVDQITKRVYGTRAFWKCYLMDFLLILGIIDSKQVDIFIYICEHTEASNNIFVGTQSSIAEATGISRPTVCKMFKKLQENNFIRKINQGAWYVNPNILMKGNDEKRRAIMLNYEKAEQEENAIAIERASLKESGEVKALPTIADAPPPTDAKGLEYEKNLLEG